MTEPTQKGTDKVTRKEQTKNKTNKQKIYTETTSHLTGRSAIGPEGRNLCHATLLSVAYSGKKQVDSYELVTWITSLSCSAAYGTVNLQNFTSDKWRVATTADWSYRCSTFLILASFRTTELWPSAPICKTKRYKATSSAAPKKANIPVYKPQSACTHFLFIQEKKNPAKPEEVAPSALVQFSTVFLHQVQKSLCTVSHSISDRVSHSPHSSPPRGWSGTHGIRTKSSGKDLGKRWRLINRNKKFSYQQFGLKSASIS